MDSMPVENPIEVFRSSLPFVILCGIAIVLPIHAGIIFLDRKLSKLKDTIPVLLAFFATDVIMTSIGLALAVAYYKIYIYSDRILGYNFWGKYHDLAWIEVERVRPIGDRKSVV